ncbi:DUF397 domain-containing protein [Streptomyces sp. NPDC095613]|uniref:DUF397 domain-containing protein n=1 Tax=Streptomyces sp. NPDC095613 TaxID=3155540 RepID=UPI0033299DF7
MIEPIRIPVQAWRKSSYSGSNGGECLEVADGIAGVVPVRDSKTPERSHLTFRASAFASFVQAVRRGDFTA